MKQPSQDRIRLPVLIVVAILVAIPVYLWLHRSRSPEAPASETAILPSAETGVVAKASRPFQPSSVAKRATQARGQAQQVVQVESSGQIQPIFDTSTNYESRLSAARELPVMLQEADRTALFNFLRHPDALDKDQSGHVLKNTLMDKLCAMVPPPDGLGDLLTEVYRDWNQDPVVRDYAVQHLATLYEQISVTGADGSAGKQQQPKIEATLWEALSESDSSIAGTALLGLTRLSDTRQGGINRAQIAEQALRLTDPLAAGELSRITAFQVCARLGVKEALPSLIEAAAGDDAMALRISAVNAVGMLGGPDEVRFLRGLLEGDEDRLKLPARRALETIERRQQQASAVNGRN